MDYLFEYIQNNIDSDICTNHLEDNIFIIGVCRCGFVGCSTVYLKLKISFPKYKEKVHGTIINHHFIERIHFNKNSEIIEYEYVNKVSPKEAPYLEEVLKIMY